MRARSMHAIWRINFPWGILQVLGGIHGRHDGEHSLPSLYMSARSKPAAAFSIISAIFQGF